MMTNREKLNRVWSKIVKSNTEEPGNQGEFDCITGPYVNDDSYEQDFARFELEVINGYEVHSDRELLNSDVDCEYFYVLVGECTQGLFSLKDYNEETDEITIMWGCAG